LVLFGKQNRTLRPYLAWAATQKQRQRHGRRLGPSASKRQRCSSSRVSAILRLLNAQPGDRTLSSFWIFSEVGSRLPYFTGNPFSSSAAPRLVPTCRGNHKKCSCQRCCVGSCYAVLSIKSLCNNSRTATKASVAAANTGVRHIILLHK
jgi:hypothetical protein